MWSSVSIPGTPRILILDATQNIQGWEYAFSDRLYQSLKKTGLDMEKDEPLHNINQLSDSSFNCLLFLTHSQNEAVDLARSRNRSPYLFAVCALEGFDESVLKANTATTPVVVAPLSPMSAREAGLFYLKFFTELKLHSTEAISGKMVWFSFSKARELLKRRRYGAKFGVCC